MNKSEYKEFRKVTELKTVRESYKVCKFDEYYVSVNVKYIDENGVITRGLNGIEMCASSTVQECIQNTLIRDMALEFADEGYEPEDIVFSIFEANDKYDMHEIRGILEEKRYARRYLASVEGES